MAEFSVIEECKMCGSRSIATYIRKHGDINEHILRTCLCCRYKWDEITLEQSKELKNG
jgi:DNA-directed RNA polymerase subunit M/transcription elongation factor TFIIS